MTIIHFWCLLLDGARGVAADAENTAHVALRTSADAANAIPYLRVVCNK
jgi:hypothetical protein